MRKIYKVFCSVLLTICLFGMSCLPVAASNISSDELILISESTFYDEETGATIVQRLYASNPTTNLSEMTPRAENVYMNENTYTFTGGSKFTYWVRGNFSWNSSANTATVSSVTGGYDKGDTSYISFINPSTTSSNNQGSNPKYAKAAYSITAKGTVGNFPNTCTVSIRVDSNGNLTTS